MSDIDEQKREFISHKRHIFVFLHLNRLKEVIYGVGQRASVEITR